MGTILVNDQFLDRENGSVDIEDRGYQFGDGVYEVVRVYGGNMFTAKEHLERLFESAEKIHLTLPFTYDELVARLEKLMEVNQLDTGIIYLQVTRGSSARQHHFPEQTKAVLTAYTKEVARPVADMTAGVKAIITDDVRWLRCDIKSLNLLGNLLAKQEAVSKGGFEAVLHRDGTVTEGSSSNVFIISGDTLYTHPATNLILNGITRREILKLCKEIGLSVAEQAFTLEALANADEVFMASTTAEVMPLVQLDETPVGNGKPGEWTQKLQAAFEEAVQKQCGSLAQTI
ncbi:D-amino-acid transaminase [Jeotgalibacillus aurantiacus]|uniref:D-amino-acid transaminase n=1 Tax=Jeotgalibacillus aurantiacus TaxID=2763266 RepID=UPI001D09BF9D|nr:D-amino-acid transaminase [Jeotgalibacillus aurantiacus]